MISSTTSATDHVSAVARGGALNLVGSVVYGAANFALILVLTRELGARGAGPVIVAIAVFTVIKGVAVLGANTGLVRMISRSRALGRRCDLTPLTRAAILPVAAVGVVLGAVLHLGAPSLAAVIGDHRQEAILADLFRVLAPFLAPAAIATILVQGSRGFDTMRVQVFVDRIGGALAAPIAVGWVLAAGGNAHDAVLAWGLVNAAVFLAAAVAFRHLLITHSTDPDTRTRRADNFDATPSRGTRRAARQRPDQARDHSIRANEQLAGGEPRGSEPGATPSRGTRRAARQRPDQARDHKIRANEQLGSRSLARDFWAFSLPRALGQACNIAVLWFDTLLISALRGSEDAGIYAAGTRYLLVGTFTAEAIMQAVGPRVSGLLAVGKHSEAQTVVSRAAVWQAGLIVPIYLAVAVFATPLLSIFGPDYTRASTALTILAFGMATASIFGPADSVVLMSGRSRQSLNNSLIALGVNLIGNVMLVPHYGLTAAGAVWAVTLVVGYGLPARQARRTLGITTWSRPLARVLVAAMLTMGSILVLARIGLGNTLPAAAIGGTVGMAAYLLAVRRLGLRSESERADASGTSRAAAALSRDQELP